MGKQITLTYTEENFRELLKRLAEHQGMLSPQEMGYVMKDLASSMSRSHIDTPIPEVVESVHHAAATIPDAMLGIHDKVTMLLAAGEGITIGGRKDQKTVALEPLLRQPKQHWDYLTEYWNPLVIAPGDDAFECHIIDCKKNQFETAVYDDEMILMRAGKQGLTLCADFCGASLDDAVTGCIVADGSSKYDQSQRVAIEIVRALHTQLREIDDLTDESIIMMFLGIPDYSNISYERLVTDIVKTYRHTDTSDNFWKRLLLEQIQKDKVIGETSVRMSFRQDFMLHLVSLGNGGSAVIGRKGVRYAQGQYGENVEGSFAYNPYPSRGWSSKGDWKGHMMEVEEGDIVATFSNGAMSGPYSSAEEIAGRLYNLASKWSIENSMMEPHISWLGSTFFREIIGDGSIKDDATLVLHRMYKAKRE